MAAMWHDHGAPSFLGIKPSFSFHELPEIHVEAPMPYAEARMDMQWLEALRGAVWYERHVEQVQALWAMKRPWWL